jgi:acyl carrier protein phosphodiesterase
MREHPTPESAAAGVANIQVLVERLRHPWLVVGRYNMFVINQDIIHDIQLYRLLDAIACKSTMAQELVDRYLRNYSREHTPLDLDVFYVGHTSADPREKLASLPAIQQDFTQFIHVGGKVPDLPRHT